ncbi:MAG: AmmeMemoRadiSam system radical SAM enzyme [Termitinemataceae bacterium]|nr:MAG: AmmeMemoRadiSam system radical SAM enzyme [Termitinemataceae bacterium]
MNGIRCENCPHRCVIPEGRPGRCAVRENKNGAINLPYYGFITASAIDPIEKKPLYHFRPGSKIPSFGFTGCNLNCPFCQNYAISKHTDCAGEYIKSEALVRCVEKTGFQQIAYTYSEPLVHTEFVCECAGLARTKDIANVLVTNGCCEKNTADEVLRFTDAANIDLKCFNAEKYSNILGGNFESTLAFIENAFSRGVHIEVTTLVVTGFNDNMEELLECAGFIASLSAEIPWHLNAYHPAYKYHEAPPDKNLLFAAQKKAKEKLRFVYLGNI